MDGCLDFCTEKTDDKLHIALNEHAQQIIEKYSWYKGDTIFPVPSNQKLNDYLKEAAKLAGLDREISQVYFKVIPGMRILISFGNKSVVMMQEELLYVVPWLLVFRLA